MGCVTYSYTLLWQLVSCYVPSSKAPAVHDSFSHAVAKHLQHNVFSTALGGYAVLHSITEVAELSS